ncbi:Inner membrane protein yeiU [Salmonella enterica subsp. arizonae]|uniref:Inner membrane protein yeiU n=1 Tax=Salmonella enterica subsp. arizonae TaxID=59203 RepID=A0A379T8J7_SALER|nr:Inner membrane protein yeiU [Salmonella enterica subsp. arizonae]
MTMKTRYPLIILLNAAGLALFLSWYLPVNHGFWFPIDSGIFHFFNQKLVESRAFLWWVAITNNRAFDGCSLLAMGGADAQFLAERKHVGSAAHCDNRVGHAVNGSGA